MCNVVFDNRPGEEPPGVSVADESVLPEGVGSILTEQPPDVGKAARQGGAWAVVSWAFSKVASFAGSIVLARLLMPEHFGLIGMVNTVLALVQILGTVGIGAAITHQRDNVEEYANTGWWMDVCCGIALFVLSNLVAPLAAAYYHEPMVRALIFVASINYLINPIGGVMDALIRRDLRFKTSTKIALVQGLVSSILTVVFALLGAGVWSFVYPHIVAGIVAVVLRWRKCSFRPRLGVQWPLVRKIWRFGRNMLGSAIFNYVNENCDYVLIGGLIGGRDLGLYFFAYGLGTWIVGNVSATLSSVLFPTMANLQHDPDRARRMFLKLMQMIALVGFPIVCVQLATAPLFIGTVYGQKWLGAVTAFRLIALYGIGRAVCAPALTLISAMGRPDVNFKVSAAMSPILVTAIYLGSKHGINGVAFATAVANGLFVWLYVIAPFRILGWRPLDAAQAVAPALVISILMGLATWALYSVVSPGTDSLLTLGLMIMFGALCYVAITRVLFPKVSADCVSVIKRTLREARGS